MLLSLFLLLGLYVCVLVTYGERDVVHLMLFLVHVSVGVGYFLVPLVSFFVSLLVWVADPYFVVGEKKFCCEYVRYIHILELPCMFKYFSSLRSFSCLACLSL